MLFDQCYQIKRTWNHGLETTGQQQGREPMETTDHPDATRSVPSSALSLDFELKVEVKVFR